MTTEYILDGTGGVVEIRGEGDMWAPITGPEAALAALMGREVTLEEPLQAIQRAISIVEERRRVRHLPKDLLLGVLEMTVVK